MEGTSTAWRENQQKQVTDEAFVEVLYKINDPNIALAQATADDKSYFSDLPALVGGVDYDLNSYATLEPDIWLLDGTRKCTVPAEGNYRNSGFVSSSLSNEEKEFDTPILIRIKFAENVPLLPGLTIVWNQTDQEYPTEFEITIYDADKTIRYHRGNHNSIYVLNEELKNFKQIDIKIINWSRPQRRARIEKIIMGVNKIYTKNELLKFSCSQETDPVSTTLPKYEITFELDNHDDIFNPYNENGMAKYMKEWQEINTRYGFKHSDGLIEWIPGGVYYLSDWSAPLSGWTATIKARDILGLMGATYYKGVFPRNIFYLDELAEQVLKEAKLPKYRNGEPRWYISNHLRHFWTVSPLPVCSMAECLQLIANAAGCTIHYDRSGRLYIMPFEELWQTEKSDEMEITNDNSYAKAEITLSKPVKQVDVSMYSYIKEDEKEIYTGTLSLAQGKNEFVIEYSDTAKDIETIVDGESVTVNKETEYYAKCCKLVLNAQKACTCNVKMKGTVYKAVETLISVQDEKNLSTGEIHTLKNVLVTNNKHAKEIGGQLLEHLNRRKSLSANLRIDPRLDAGDRVSVKSNLNNDIYVTSTNFSFSGAFKGKCEGTVIDNDPALGISDNK